MTERLNYCTQAIEQFGRFRYMIPKADEASQRIAALVTDTAELLRCAEKFLLPHWGRIFDENEWALTADMEVPARLPYPIVAAEYHCDYEQHNVMIEGEESSSKRIALAFDSEWISARPEQFPLFHALLGNNPDKEPGIYVFTVSYSDPEQFWSPPPAGLFYRYDEGMRHYGTLVMSPLGQQSYTLYATKEEGVNRAIRDVSDEMLAMSHLLTALALDKPRYEVLEAPVKLNKKRAKRSKPPLFEYRVLDIVADIMATPTAHAVRPHGTHASPRMHKRRGHLRRLKSGNVTWIRNTLVGRPGRGTIEKDYSVHE